MIASAPASRSIAACSARRGSRRRRPGRCRRRAGRARSRSTVAGVPASPSRSRLFCAMRSASSRVEEGSPTPALTTTRRRGGCGIRSADRGALEVRGHERSFPWRSLHAARCRCAGEQGAAEVAQLRRAARGRGRGSCASATWRAWRRPTRRWASAPASVRRMRQARPSSGSATRSTRPRGLEPRDEARHAGLGEQHVVAELGDPQAVRGGGQGVEHAVLARAAGRPTRRRRRARGRSSPGRGTAPPTPRSRAGCGSPSAHADQREVGDDVGVAVLVGRGAR